MEHARLVLVLGVDLTVGDGLKDWVPNGKLAWESWALLRSTSLDLYLQRSATIRTTRLHIGNILLEAKQ